MHDEKINILLVDDRADGLLALEAVLTCGDYNLVKASSGKEALGCLLENHFALILLDVQMPEMDGFETARLIKQRKLYQEIPIIFLTAISKDSHHIYQGYESGAVDYLFKPFDPYVLRSKVAIFAELFRKNKKIVEQTNLLLEHATALKNLNMNLEMEMMERLKAQKEILEISEREQKRIGQDLHDGLAQQLTAISYIGRVLWEKLSLKGLSEAEDAFEILNLARKMVDEAKGIAKGFFPIELERNGLAAALKDLLVSTERMYQISCSHQFDESVQMKDFDAETHLYRIAQEAIHNTVKHGKAKQILLSINRSASGELLMTIEDDGIGFSDQNGSTSGMGIRIMKYRAKMLGGALDVKTNVSGGTRIVFKMPFESKKMTATVEERYG